MISLFICESSAVYYSVSQELQIVLTYVSDSDVTGRSLLISSWHFEKYISFRKLICMPYSKMVHFAQPLFVTFSFWKNFWNLGCRPLWVVEMSVSWTVTICVIGGCYSWSAENVAYLTFWHRSFTFNSNKSPTWSNNFSVYYPDVCLQLNMFQVFSHPPSGAQWLQWQPLVLPSYRDDSRAVFVVGPAGLTTNTAQLSSQYKGKTRGCYCSHWAPDGGRENARNMLSCKQTSG
jgi:hypothetical protein